MSALRGNTLTDRPPLIFNDHKEAQSDRAAAAIRIDSPRVGETVVAGQWKLFFDASLLRAGEAKPYELFNLAEDPREQSNLISDPGLTPLIERMAELAVLHRNTGGHRLSEIASQRTETIDWTHGEPPRVEGLEFSVSAIGGEIASGDNGLGISGGRSDAVDGGEAIVVIFNQDVLVESAAIAAGDGAVGGFYRVGPRAPLAIYCVDGDIDSLDQSGILSDIGLLKKGEELRFDSGSHYGNEPPGEWHLQNLTVRLLQ